MKRLRLVPLLCVFGTAAAGAAKAPDWVVRARAVAVAPELLAARPEAVVLWRQQIVTAGASTGSTKLFSREAVKILTPEGKRAGTFFSSYDDDSKVDVEGAWTLHADGSAEDLNLREVVSVQLAHAEYFTDTYLVAFQPPRLAPGDVASFALSRKSRRDVYQWVLRLQDGNPIAAQQVVVDLPEGWTHRWRLTSMPEGYSGPLAGEGGAKASYLFGPQRGVPEEEEAPPQMDRLAGLEIAIEPPADKFRELVFRNWNEVGAWFYRKSSPARGDAPAEVLPGAAPAPSDAARWIQEKIRYVAIEVGEGGYVPREPALVAKRLYGDCKDKGFLFIALLARRGIEAFPVLTRPRSGGAIDPEFPSPVQFNHSIVAVRVAEPTGLASETRLSQGSVVLFDPTDPWTPYGQLPASLQGGRGLLVQRDAAQLIEFPAAAAVSNRMTRHVDAEISPSQRFTATVTDVTDGTVSQRRLYQEQTPVERNEALLRFAQSHIPASRASALELANLEDRDKPMQARFSLTAEAYVHKTGSLLLLPLLPFSVGPRRIARLAERRSPIDLGSPRLRELTATFRLPETLKIDALPDPIDVQNAFCRYRFSISSQGSRLTATETYEIVKPLIPLSEISSWKAIESAAARAAASKAVLMPAN